MQESKILQQRMPGGGLGEAQRPMPKNPREEEKQGKTRVRLKYYKT